MPDDSIPVGAASRRVPVEPAKTYRLLKHGPVTLVTSAHAGRHDLSSAEVAAAWADLAALSEGRRCVPDVECRSMRHLAGGAFFATGEGLQVVPGERE